jgi:diadenosine tetraphosphate (Ap4A) HIT family hydrolase
MSTLIHQHVDACRAGTNLRTLCRTRSGWVVLGEVQFLRGYCLLLPDPVVADLNQLDRSQRQLFLEEMTVVGDALLALTDAVRINYEMLGNVEPALHAHIFPRYHDEPANLRTSPVWLYDWKAAPPFDLERDAPLMEAVRAYLRQAGVAEE